MLAGFPCQVLRGKRQFSRTAVEFPIRIDQNHYKQRACKVFSSRTRAHGRVHKRVKNKLHYHLIIDTRGGTSPPLVILGREFSRPRRLRTGGYARARSRSWRSRRSPALSLPPWLGARRRRLSPAAFWARLVPSPPRLRGASSLARFPLALGRALAARGGLRVEKARRVFPPPSHPTRGQRSLGVFGGSGFALRFTLRLPALFLCPRAPCVLKAAGESGSGLKAAPFLSAGAQNRGNVPSCP